MTRKGKCHSKSNSFVAAAEQVCLQPVLEHRQRRGRRDSHHAFAHHNIPRSYRVDVGAKQQTSLEKEVMKTLQRHNLSNRTLLHTSQRYLAHGIPTVSRWLGSRVVSVLDSGAEGPGFKSQSRRCRVTVLGELFTPIVLLFTKQRNW